ncbi:MAG: toxin-antitoxin system YwqK family antitoxin [Candidatus Marinimicrobia bacterium]|nr:toxin-antitoxin system YwqK family antitoxin [Candidatus Neomarinimicrobiota bacterium]MBT3676565.1 toxin-antitoxin system YwqK family antitoxin [Candidatus Neomarinimicrobiota bacterium]MBT3763366.1 toxin-antitoxin system YwqK family antitoxin [Candidatus Neomarinimicrobiota bacterium]MBT4069053.1 toxin-antitoxin system YwqK family antitoxin [Candidatus Neomarinimicrobiota bacterium]MBT4271131.1 toxin-antitoxin system YwqK family antitoxin [Candidatus Neomarinimicrobiota bacterium]
MRIFIFSIIFLMVGCESSTVTFDETFSINNGELYHNNSLFSGRLIKTEITGTWSKSFYKNGKREGLSIRHFADGNKKSHGKFRKGNQVGTHLGWWPNGQIRSEQYFNDGLLSGEVKEWFVNGQLAVLNHFSNGRQDGLQQGWRNDGDLRFKYTYINGKRYGFMGSSLCMSPYQ